MTAYLFRPGHDLYEFVGQVLWMGCHKTDPLNSVYLLHFLQKLRKGHGIVQVLSIGIYILTKEHDFHHSVRCQLLYFLNDFFRPAAALPSSYIGYNTVAAEIIAAKHNIDSRLKRKLAFHRQILYDLVRILPYIHNHLRFSLLLSALGPPLQAQGYQFRQLEDIVGSENQIHITVAFPDFLHYFLFLHHAAAQGYHHVRMRLLIGPQLSQAAVNPKIGIFPHRTCIIEHKIRFL